MSVCYIHGGLNISDGLTKDMSSANLGILLSGNSIRIFPGIQKDGIRNRLPESKHYIVYTEEIQGGGKDLDIDMRRKTRVGRSSH